MGLRRQLLLVAVITLALPWAGCQYIEEMERALRQGQMSALQATSQAVSARFSSDALLASTIADALNQSPSSSLEHAFYVHPLKGELSLDGYASDWSQLGFLDSVETSSTLLNDNRSRAFLAQKSGALYMLIRVRDPARQFYNPSLSVSVSDHIRLYFGGSAENRELQIFSAAPGTVTVEGKGADGKWYRQYKVSGVWNEKESSYYVELKMPLEWVESGLAIELVDGAVALQSGYVVQGEKSASLNAKPLTPVIIPRYTFDETLSVFQRDGVKLRLVTVPYGWSLGKAGQLYSSNTSHGPKTWIYRFVRWIVKQNRYPSPVSTPLDERVLGAEVDKVFDGNEASQWYSGQSGMVARVVTPLRLPGGSFAAVVAEESTDAIEVLTNGAIGRLLFYSFLVTLIVLAVLLAYASILSFRVRKLSADAQEAVDEDGRIVENFPVSRSKDEIGELSRIYGSLLQRLRSYTSYLETLSSKLSHELRTPLAIVSSSLDNLHQHSLKPEVKVYVDRAIMGALRLSSILSAMSAAARVEQSIQNSEMERVDLTHLLKQMVSAYRDAHHPCRMVFLTPDIDSALIKAAPDSLVQMLDKLVENAVDFAGPTGCVWFELERYDKEVRLRVVNDGPLLVEGFQEQIFDSLVSLRDENTAESYESTEGLGGQHLGLGLHIVRLIVHTHGGEIRAYNDAKEGRVVFEAKFPLI